MDYASEPTGHADATGAEKFLVAATALSPPATGIALIAIVVADAWPSMITRSPAVAATALVVAAFLILGSAALYCWRPGNFLDFAKIFTHHKTSTEPQSNTTDGSHTAASEDKRKTRLFGR